MSEASHFTDVAATWDDPAKIARTAATAALLHTHLPLTGRERVLDIGGGTGQLGIHLAHTLGSVTVLDPAAGMIAAATANIAAASLADRFTAIEHDLQSDPAPDPPFNGAMSQLALHHVADVDALLRNAFRALVPGGWLAVIDLDIDPDGAFHAHRPDFGGHHGFDRDSFADRMRGAGFTDVSVLDGGVVEQEVGDGTRKFPMFLAIGYAAR